MQYRIWILNNNLKKFIEIPKHCISGVELGMKTNEPTQMRFSLNTQNLDINNFVTQKIYKILLELEDLKILLDVAKVSYNSNNTIGINLVIDYYDETKLRINPLLNQVYTGSLLNLISILCPNWQVDLINNQDLKCSISVGTDDILQTITKAVEQGGGVWSIQKYSDNNKPIIAIGKPENDEKIKATDKNIAASIVCT